MLIMMKFIKQKPLVIASDSLGIAGHAGDVDLGALPRAESTYYNCCNIISITIFLYCDFAVFGLRRLAKLGKLLT